MLKKINYVEEKLMLTQTLEKLIEPQIVTRNKEFRYLTNEVSWQEYEALLAQLEDSLQFRVTYLDQTLEIMSPSRNHEIIKTRIGSLLEMYFFLTNTEYYGTGSTTFRKEEKRGGSEPDESYCIGTDKEFPDLVIEVIFSSGGINKLAVYQRLGVKEVWFWQNDRFLIYHLCSDNLTETTANYGYKLINFSDLLPDLNLDLLNQCVNHPHALTAIKELKNYVQKNLNLE